MARRTLNIRCLYCDRLNRTCKGKPRGCDPQKANPTQDNSKQIAADLEAFRDNMIGGKG